MYALQKATVHTRQTKWKGLITTLYPDSVHTTLIQRRKLSRTFSTQRLSMRDCIVSAVNNIVLINSCEQRCQSCHFLKEMLTVFVLLPFSF
jgi:hypothetical protein